jgi:ubiquitin C-terminal hydrolase
MDNIDTYFEFLKKDQESKTEDTNTNNNYEEDLLNLNRQNSNNSNNLNYIYHDSSTQMNSYGIVGLKNLCCICYMNSMLQQFFMVPSFRFSVLQAEDNLTENRNNNEKIDDNVLHQVQRMFSFLTLSKRVDYNMYDFCFSFKDFEVNFFIKKRANQQIIEFNKILKNF